MLFNATYPGLLFRHIFEFPSLLVLLRIRLPSIVDIGLHYQDFLVAGWLAFL